MTQPDLRSRRAPTSSIIRSISFGPNTSLRDVDGGQTAYVYLVQSGLLSTSISLADGTVMGVGMNSAGDLLNLEPLLGAREIDGVTQALTSVSALRIPKAHFQAVLHSNAAFRNCLFVELGRRVRELEFMVACSRFHSLEQRLTRLLLLLHSRVGSSTLLMTQATLARELGVMRTSVVAAIATLRSKHLISLSRGAINLDQIPALEQVACQCYHTLKAREAERIRSCFAIQQHLLAGSHALS